MIEKHEFNGFTYKMDTIKGDLTGFELVHGKAKPKSIYKYYGISSFSIDALKNGYFYASHPMELNDHLDSSNFLLGASKPIDYEFYERFLGEAYGKEIEQLKKYYDDDSVSKDGIFYSTGFISELWQVMSNIFGIISLTSQDKSDLMWPHYTNEKGFQIMFETEELETSIKAQIGDDECLGLFPMNYCENLYPIDLSDFSFFHTPFLYLTNVKKNSWAYEDEWRFIVSKKNMGIPFSKVGLDPRDDHKGDKENRRAYYDKNIIKEITLGNNFFTGREFDIDRSAKDFIIVKPLKSKNNWNYQDHIDFLEYVYENFSDRLYYSGKTFNINDGDQPYLIRTKERLEIENLGDNKYKLTRTNDFY
ncbi:DUF2971 domain-containing protein [Tamlana sp. 2201CG12-4]|uniref:DUF2971 domain-containing protein n=1 Tax=Tamlana sp. 2201CG12-4 TaxID=3112582 RepID=UPI002DBA9033|nr:DUF2971 domain-containing protein [Tamlana sp. 2201CG12-4]MEC3906440.1 DUF2971 domain-containing protein [Tamlana sp. 2201CG12-4]